MLIACPNCATACPSLDVPVLEPGRCAFCGSVRLAASTTPDESPATTVAIAADIERDLLRKLAEVLEPAQPCPPADAPEPIADAPSSAPAIAPEPLADAPSSASDDAPAPLAGAVSSAPDIAPEPIADAVSPAPDIAPEPLADAPSSAPDIASEPRAEAFVLDVVPERGEAIASAPTMPPMERMEPTRSVRPPQKSSRRRDIASYVARRQRLNAARQPFRLPRIGLPAAILALVAAASTLVAGRSEIVRHAPQTASLYAALGMPVNLRALDFDNVTTAREDHSGVNVLIVEGTIVSSAAKPVDVPQLRFAIRNPDGLEIYSWTAPPERPMLAPGEQMAFRSRLAAPPPESSEVMVRFLGGNDAVAGLQ